MSSPTPSFTITSSSSSSSSNSHPSSPISSRSSSRSRSPSPPPPIPKSILPSRPVLQLHFLLSLLVGFLTYLYFQNPTLPLFSSLPPFPSSSVTTSSTPPVPSPSQSLRACYRLPPTTDPSCGTPPASTPLPRVVHRKHQSTVFCHPSTGGTLILHPATPVELAALNITALSPSHSLHSTDPSAEDAFCRSLRNMGGVWWRSVEEWEDTMAPEAEGRVVGNCDHLRSRFVVGFEEGDGVRVKGKRWVVRAEGGGVGDEEGVMWDGKQEMWDALGRVVTMRERVGILKSLGAVEGEIEEGRWEKDEVGRWGVMRGVSEWRMRRDAEMRRQEEKVMKALAEKGKE